MISCYMPTLTLKRGLNNLNLVLLALFVYVSLVCIGMDRVWTGSFKECCNFNKQFIVSMKIMHVLSECMTLIEAITLKTKYNEVLARELLNIYGELN